MPLADDIFGSDGVIFIQTIRHIIPNLKGTVRDFYQSASEYYWKESEIDGLYSYWSELFGRAYIAASASLIRHEQWISGMEACYQTSSYLGLCGCLRGLVESAADSAHALECFVPSIVPIWNDLKQILKGQKIEKSLNCKDLEDILIHFSFARKPKKGESVPDGHKALPNRDYIDTLRRFDPAFERLYCMLVELVHPAKDSVDWMLTYTQTESHWDVSLHSGEEASSKICDLLDGNRAAILNLLMVSSNLSLLTLKTLRRIDFKDVNLEFMDAINLSGLPAWRDVENNTTS